MGYHFLREVSQSAVSDISQVLDSSKVIDSIERRIDAGVKTVVVVHANNSNSIYRLAAEGKITLFYSPTPVSPKIMSDKQMVTFEGNDVTLHYAEDHATVEYTKEHLYLSNWLQYLRRLIKKEHEYYFVPPQKAPSVREMIKRKESPQKIVSYLELENKVTSKEGIYAKSGFRLS